MDEVLDDIASSVARRAFLYDDPVSFRAGVRETVRAMNAILERMVRRRHAAEGSDSPGAPDGGR
jgi:hypothetical protein